MKNILFVFTLLLSALSFGQAKVNYTSIDKKMAEIPSNLTTSTDSIAKYINTHFKTENDKIRAAFYWTAANISYDIENMFVVNYNETRQDRIAKTLKTKTGICVDYAVVFNEIAKATGIKTVLISGYTKINDRVSNLSHAWSAAKIDGKWYLFDPTWGSGYVNSTDNKYIRRTNFSFYKMTPELMINSHMPFDYLWQFMNYPITNKEFIEGIIAGDETKEKFDFIKEIDKQESLSKANQFFESSQRIQKNGMKNQLISQAYVDATRSWNYEKDKENRDKHNENNSKANAIVKQFNEAIKELNDFVHYRNNQFIPILPDDQIKAKIQIPNDKLKKCKEDFLLIEPIENANTDNLNDLKKAVDEMIIKSESHLEFVKNYLSKPKLVRKTMFTKKYSSGIPSN